MLAVCWSPLQPKLHLLLQLPEESHRNQISCPVDEILVRGSSRVEYDHLMESRCHNLFGPQSTREVFALAGVKVKESRLLVLTSLLARPHPSQIHFRRYNALHLLRTSLCRLYPNTLGP